MAGNGWAWDDLGWLEMAGDGRDGRKCPGMARKIAGNGRGGPGMSGNGWGCPRMAGRSVVVWDYKRKARKRFAIFIIKSNHVILLKCV